MERLLGEYFADRAHHPETDTALAQTVRDRLLARASITAHARTVAGFIPQEFRVLDHVCDGKGNREIAEAIRVSESTVKFHLANLYRKFGVSTRRQLVDAARRKDISPNSGN